LVTGGAGGFGMSVNDAGLIGFAVYTEAGGAYKTLRSTTVVEANTIYDVTGIYDGKNIYIYVNGVLEGTLETAGGVIKNPTNGEHTIIGSNPSNSTGTGTDAGNLAKMKLYSAKIWTAPAKNESSAMRKYSASNLDGKGTTGTAMATIKDLAENTDGTVYNSPTFGNGYIALNQGGSANIQYIDAGTMLDLSQVTVKLKFSVSEIGTAQHLFGNWESGGFGIYLNANGKIAMSVYTENSTAYQYAYSTSAIATNTIYDLTGIYDGTYVYLYLNGVLQQKIETPGGNIKNPANNEHLVIGANPGGTGVSTAEYAKMKLYNAEVYIWE